MGRNSVMAEDITHDVFLQTLKHASRIGKMVDPVAYIMVATRNHSYNMLNLCGMNVKNIAEYP